MIHKWEKQPNGFTIVELLIVIVVIGILAAITIVAYNGIQKRAQFAKVESDTSTAINKLEIFKVDNSLYPTSVTDCPVPAATNLCLVPSSGDSYTYRALSAGGSGYAGIVSQASYELTVLNTSNFLYTSPAEKTGTSEFMQYVDLAPVIDTYGLVKYQLSFDIKSANTTSNASINVYFQNGSTARYAGLSTNVGVTTGYVRHVLNFTPTLSNGTVAQSMLAFYGTYGTGNIPSIKNLRVQLAPS